MDTTAKVRKALADEAGIILPLVLVLLALGLLLLTPALGHGYSALAGSSITETRAEQLHAADSGVEEGLYWLTRGRPGSEYVADDPDNGPWVRGHPYALNGNNVFVTITRTTNEQYQQHLYLIESRAEAPDGDPSTVLALVYAVPFATIMDGPWTQNDDYDHPDEDLAVNGDVTIGQGNTDITLDSLAVDGSLTLGQGATLTADVYTSGDITLGQSAAIICDVLCTEGNLTLGQSSDVNPLSVDVVTEVHFLDLEGSVLTFDNTATLTGDIYSAGDLTINMYHKHNTLTGNIYVEGNLTIDMTGSQSQASVVGPASQGGLANIYATGNVYIRMDSKFSKVQGNLYYISGNTYTKVGSSQAMWPTPHVCADAEACTWPESDLDCPLFPSNDAAILTWEVT